MDPPLILRAEDTIAGSATSSKDCGKYALKKDDSVNAKVVSSAFFPFFFRNLLVYVQPFAV